MIMNRMEVMMVITAIVLTKMLPDTIPCVVITLATLACLMYSLTGGERGMVVPYENNTDQTNTVDGGPAHLTHQETQIRGDRVEKFRVPIHDEPRVHPPPSHPGHGEDPLGHANHECPTTHALPQRMEPTTRSGQTTNKTIKHKNKYSRR